VTVAGRAPYRAGVLPLLARPALLAYLLMRAGWHFCLRVFIAEPFFKASCREFGAGVRTDIYPHAIHGTGDLVVGDDVLIDGKCTFAFGGGAGDERPRLVIGSHTGIGHECTIRVARRVSIGSHCMIAPGVSIFDTGAAQVAARAPATVTIQDNVWIGGRAIILPGVTVGEGSIVSAGAVVTADVPPYTVVAGNPARRVGALA
jgi:acetyltransferase-like isoleucine patch superfamily enzyme